MSLEHDNDDKHFLPIEYKRSARFFIHNEVKTRKYKKDDTKDEFEDKKLNDDREKIINTIVDVIYKVQKDSCVLKRIVNQGMAGTGKSFVLKRIALLATKGGIYHHLLAYTGIGLAKIWLRITLMLTMAK